jgi:hypothetical protein
MSRVCSAVPELVKGPVTQSESDPFRALSPSLLSVYRRHSVPREPDQSRITGHGSVAACEPHDVRRTRPVSNGDACGVTEQLSDHLRPEPPAQRAHAGPKEQIGGCCSPSTTVKDS